MDVFSFLISIHSHRWRRARCSDSHIGGSRWTVAAADCGGNHRPHSHRLDIPVLPSVTSSLPPSHTHAHKCTHTHTHAHAHTPTSSLKFQCVIPSLPPTHFYTSLSLSHTHTCLHSRMCVHLQALPQEWEDGGCQCRAGTETTPHDTPTGCRGLRPSQ